jgi:alpha-galactosidase
LSRLTKKYPNVLFENCASGGNRLDLGMLSYMSQSWPSDMSDPIGRLKIINGCSYLFPLDVLSAYIGPSPNHQNGRITSVSSRFNAGAFCAAQGVSLNYSDIDKNKGELTDLVNFAKEHSSDMIGGNFYRLKKSDNVFCWQYITKDYEKVFLLYFHILSGPNKPFEHIKFVGLEKNSDYLQVCNDKLYSGNLLMENGFTLPYVSMTDDNNKVSYMPKGDFSSKLFVFQKI